MSYVCLSNQNVLPNFDKCYRKDGENWNAQVQNEIKYTCDYQIIDDDIRLICSPMFSSSEPGQLKFYVNTELDTDLCTPNDSGTLDCTKAYKKSGCQLYHDRKEYLCPGNVLFI